jgi:hypothetical protein
MSNQQRYNKEDGEVSKSGRTIVRTSKSGRKYYHNPNSYAELKRKKRELAKKEGKEIRGEYDKQRSSIYCADKNNEAYMRYFQKKSEIRHEYPNWVHMYKEEWREYFKRVLNLMETDEDYLQYKLETKTLAEKEEDIWWEEKNEKDKNYNGSGEEYR